MLPTFSAVEPFSCPKYSESPVGLLVDSVSLKAQESQIAISVLFESCQLFCWNLNQL